MATKKGTTTQVLSPIDAIWSNTDCGAEEKLVMYYLTTRHQTGEKYTQAYLTVDKFISTKEEQWSNFKDIEAATHLSKVKLERTLTQLSSKKLIQVAQRPVRATKKNKNQDLLPKENHYDVTDKLFVEALGGTMPMKSIA
jgi:hypothetical protein